MILMGHVGEGKPETIGHTVKPGVWGTEHFLALRAHVIPLPPVSLVAGMERGWQPGKSGASVADD